MSRDRIDLTDWTTEDRSVRYHYNQGKWVFGFITGMQIRADGKAELIVYPEMCMPWSPPPATYGTHVKGWVFVKPRPEIDELLKLATGITKPGAPLPAATDERKEEPTTKPEVPPRDEFDTLDDKPARPKAKATVKGSGL